MRIDPATREAVAALASHLYDIRADAAELCARIKHQESTMDNGGTLPHIVTAGDGIAVMREEVIALIKERAEHRSAIAGAIAFLNDELARYERLAHRNAKFPAIAGDYHDLAARYRAQVRILEQAKHDHAR